MIHSFYGVFSFWVSRPKWIRILLDTEHVDLEV